ncbi:MAG: hypothetical protein ABSH28_24225, partial [Acidobacteriota bacterium]
MIRLLPSSKDSTMTKYRLFFGVLTLAIGWNTYAGATPISLNLADIAAGADLNWETASYGYDIKSSFGNYDPLNPLINVLALSVQNATDPVYGIVPAYLYFISENGDWTANVLNSRGWVIETEMRLDGSTETLDPTSPYYNYYNVALLINDDTYSTYISINPGTVFVGDPDLGGISIDVTTTDYHTYRIEGQDNFIKLYVDDQLEVTYQQPGPSGGTEALAFGDQYSYGSSISYWKSFSYDTDPAPAVPEPS